MNFIANILLVPIWTYVLSWSVLMFLMTGSYELRHWREVIAGIFLLPALGALYAACGWTFPVLSSNAFAILLGLPSLLAIVLHGRAIVTASRTRVLHRSSRASYYLSGKRIHVDGFWLEGVDPATFRVLSAPYARDRSNVNRPGFLGGSVS